MTPEPTSRTFGLVLRDLLIAKGFTSKMGNADFAGFSRALKHTHYESLRKAVSGTRQPSPGLMEDCAATLGVPATVFAEYDLWQAQQSLDPVAVGLPAAMEALENWRASKE